MFEVDHRIAGNAVATECGRVADIVDPNTGKVQKRVTLGMQADLDRAVAQMAQPAWAATNPQPVRA